MCSLPLPKSESTSSTTSLCTEAVSMDLSNSLKEQDITLSKFARQVMGVSPSRMNSLIRQPRPWVRLRTRGRKMYGKMRLWVEMVERRKSIRQFVEHALAGDEGGKREVLSEEFVQEMTVGDGQEMWGRKERKDDKGEDRTELVNVTGEEMKQLKTEQVNVSWGESLVELASDEFVGMEMGGVSEVWGGEGGDVVFYLYR